MDRLVKFIAFNVAFGWVVGTGVAQAATVLATPEVFSPLAGAVLECPVTYTGTVTTAATASVTTTIFDSTGAVTGTATCPGPFLPNHQMCNTFPVAAPVTFYHCQVTFTGVPTAKVRAAIALQDFVTAATIATLPATH